MKLEEVVLIKAMESAIKLLSRGMTIEYFVDIRDLSIIEINNLK